MLIDLERDSTRSLAGVAPTEELCVCAMTVYELQFGIENASGARRVKRATFLAEVLAVFTPIALDANIATQCAQLAHWLKARGESIGLPDTWIAATALVHGHRVLTGNVKHFARVPGLQVLPWP